MLTVMNRLNNRNNKLYYDSKFRMVLEHHMKLLKERLKPAGVPTDLPSYTERGDFRMFLLEIGVPVHLHWIIMRLNGISDVTNWYPLTEGLRVISEDDELLSDIINAFKLNNAK